MVSTHSNRYVLVTPTKNEERLIPETIASVVAQTIRPLEWVIVSDGSTDETASIVRRTSLQHPWIRLVELPPRSTRNFAAVVHATETGIKALTVQDYTYLGLLDSDLRFAPEYFERVLAEFAAHPRLGLAGGVAIDIGLPKDRLPFNRQDVPGAVQFFRRECFEGLGGLIAIPEGGWDALTCARARMIGYETRLLTDLVVDHLKPRNIAEGGALRRKWQMGVRDYALGYHPLFELLKCAGKLRDRPWLIGAASWWLGYCYSWLLRRHRIVPKPLLDFVRTEQRRRIRSLTRG